MESGSKSSSSPSLPKRRASSASAEISSKGRGDARTLFKEETLVFEERLALLFSEKRDLISWHGKGGPLVSLELVAGVELQKIKIPLGVTDGGEGKGTGGVEGQ